MQFERKYGRAMISLYDLKFCVQWVNRHIYIYAIVQCLSNFLGREKGCYGMI